MAMENKMDEFMDNLAFACMLASQSRRVCMRVFMVLVILIYLVVLGWNTYITRFTMDFYKYVHGGLEWRARVIQSGKADNICLEMIIFMQVVVMLVRFSGQVDLVRAKDLWLHQFAYQCTMIHDADLHHQARISC